MHPADCPEFEYEHHPRRREVLSREGARIIAKLRRRATDTCAAAEDTRPTHRRLFRRLTPRGFKCYAGHYRGEDYRCLRHYPVGIRGDPRVGLPAIVVGPHMRDLRYLIRSALAGLDASHSLPDSHLPIAEKLAYTVAVACRVFVTLLTIHPYANGNGHAGRFCIWALLGRYDYWPERWPLDPRPPDPPYTDLIRTYRDGNPEPLESFVLQCIAG